MFTLFYTLLSKNYVLVLLLLPGAHTENKQFLMLEHVQQFILTEHHSM